MTALLHCPCSRLPIVGAGIACLGLGCLLALIPLNHAVAVAGIILLIAGLILLFVSVKRVQKVVSPPVVPSTDVQLPISEPLEYAILYKAALDAHALVTMTDVRGTITYANDNFCRLHGFTREELIGKNHRIVSSGLHAAKFYEEIFRNLAHGQSWRGEVRNRTKNGGHVWLETTIVPYRDERGAIQQYIAVRADITQRKMAEQRVAESHQELECQAAALEIARQDAEKANQAKSMYLANISHEIRTPMTAILGFTELLMETAHLDAADRGSVAAIQRNGQYLLQLVNDILDLSKIEAGKMNIEKNACDISMVLAETIGMTRPKAREKGLALSLHYMTRVPAVIQTDGLRLRQILINLVSNAIKFTPKGSVRIEVSATTEAANAVVQITVRDTGIGISPEKVESIFRPFTQADASTSRRYGGTGLGLTISRELARLLGGDITASSVPGKGSEFTLRILAQIDQSVDMIEPEDMNARTADETSQRPATLSGRMLVVEDSEDIQALLKLMLSNTDLSIDLAVNGADGLKMACDQQYDLILMDMHMPVMDGYTATSQLRAHGIQTPIIALTARAMSSDRDQCLAAGCTDYLTKPIQRECLLGKISQYLVASRRANTEIKPAQEPKPGPVGVDGLVSSPAYQKLLSNFLIHLNQLSVELQKAAEAEDLAAIESMTHQLKGTGATFGLELLSKQAAAAEVAAKNRQNIQTIRAEVAELVCMMKQYGEKKQEEVKKA